MMGRLTEVTQEPTGNDNFRVVQTIPNMIFDEDAGRLEDELLGYVLARGESYNSLFPKKKLEMIKNYTILDIQTLMPNIASTLVV